jgi:hypothetical protein
LEHGVVKAAHQPVDLPLYKRYHSGSNYWAKWHVQAVDEGRAGVIARLVHHDVHALVED